MVEVKLFELGLESATPRGEVLVSELGARQLAVRRAAPAGEPGPWIIAFQRVDPALFEAVRGASGGGLGRVIALSLAGDELGPALAQRLRAAGASEVLADGAKSAGIIAARLARWGAVDRIIASPLVQRHLIGKSAAWIESLRELVEAAAFSDASLLLLGESGTGKEQLARLVHALDPREPKGELVVLDCTTVAPELAGSEFFGHERGAFTGATGPRDGAFALADGGTLFLDEVGELPLPLQAQLLRVIQERAFKRVGGNTWQQTRFRLICATHRDLAGEVRAGGFRTDFFHRIAGWSCRIPPLRERPEDVLPLVEHFLAEARPDEAPPGIDETVRDLLLQRSYPGNVRELRHLVCGMRQRHVGEGPITIGDLPREELAKIELSDDWQDSAFHLAITRALFRQVGLKEIGRAARDTAIQIAVATENGNLQRAARRLGVTDRALQMHRASRGT